MAFTRESLVNKVLRAMDRADDARTPQGERDESARVAARLIARHQIDEAELREQQKGHEKSPIIMFTFEVSNLGGFGKERSDALAWAAVHPFGGSTYRTWWKAASVPTKMRVFIREDLKDVALVLLEALSKQLMALEKAATKEYVQEQAEYMRQVNWIELTASQRSQKAVEFRRGYIPSWGTHVARRIKTGRKEALAEAQAEKQAEAYASGASGEELYAIAAKIGTGMELALVDDQKAAQDFRDQYTVQKFGKPLGSNHKQRKDVRVAYEGIRAGRQDAHRTDIGLTRVG